MLSPGLAPVYGKPDAPAVTSQALHCREKERTGSDLSAKKAQIGTDVPCVSWISPRIKPWAVLLCIHGLSLHAESFADFGRRMSDIGVPTYAIDVRGFGSWQNTKDFRELDFTGALKDIESSLQSLRLAHPGLPIVLLGESMGGALALHAAANDQSLIDGLICSVPAAQSCGQNLTMAKVILGLFTAPNRKLNAGPRIVRRATTDPELVRFWEQDEMARMGLSSKELLAYGLFGSQNGAQAQKISEIPVLIVQGVHDRLIKPAGTWELYSKIKSPRKELVTFALEHLIFENDQFDVHVLDTVSSWVQQNAVVTASERDSKQDQSLPRELLEQCEGHFKLAEGFLLLKDTKSAQEQLFQAIKLGPRSHIARKAEAIICALPDESMAPAMGAGTGMADEDFKFVTHQQAFDNDKPSVMFFYADWVHGCKLVEEVINGALARYGSKVNFVRIDADEPVNQDLLKRYAIRPLPALLYLNDNNEVVGYTFGFPGQQVIDIKIRDLIAKRLTAGKSTAYGGNLPH